MAKAKPVVKAAALDKTINASIDSLTKAYSDAVTAIAKKSAEAKKLLTEIKRHLKKKATLTKRSKAATAKLKKDANAANKKAVTAVARELKATNAALDKARARKTVILTELAALKISSKRLMVYTKVIATADKALNKPAKKRRKKLTAK